jgi:hypothetical protein
VIDYRLLNVSKNLFMRYFSRSTRMLFHIADAPCHGIQFHSFTVDHFPGGDPKGRSLESLLGQLADNEIQYHFGKINERTDKMVEAFARVYAGDLVICEMKNADQLLDNVVSTASIAVTQGQCAKMHLKGNLLKKHLFCSWNKWRPFPQKCNS